MTSDKHFKRKVRSRMERTGEPYTLARRELLVEQADPRLVAVVEAVLWRTLATRVGEFVPDEAALMEVSAAASIDRRPHDAASWTSVTAVVAHDHRGALSGAVVDELDPHIPAEWCGDEPPRLVAEACAQLWDPKDRDPYDQQVVRAAIALASHFGDSRAQVHDLYPVSYRCESCGQEGGVTNVDCDWPMGVINGDRVTGRGWHCPERCDRPLGADLS